MEKHNHIVYYNGVRVFPEHASNIGFNNNDITKYSKYICKCGSIFCNRESTKALHINSSKHKRYIINNPVLKNTEMFELYRV